MRSKHHPVEGGKQGDRHHDRQGRNPPFLERTQLLPGLRRRLLLPGWKRAVAIAMAGNLPQGRELSRSAKFYQAARTRASDKMLKRLDS